MKSLILRYCIAGLMALLLGTAPLQAARVGDLFQVEVNAAGRDVAARDSALQQALQDVLVRVTGSARSVEQAPARQLLQRPGRFVEQYRFEEVALPTGEAGSGMRIALFALPWDHPTDAGREWVEDGVGVVNVPLPPRVPLLFHVLLTLRLVGRAKLFGRNEAQTQQLLV